MSKKSPALNVIFVHRIDGVEVSKEEVIRRFIKKYPKKEQK
jgi:hypothetical protein